jgi:hypothetical protein
MEIKSAYLFYGDADLSSAEGKLLSILKIAMNEVELEQERIKSNLEKLNNYRKLRRKIGKKKAQAKFFEENNYIYEEIMADIHLWLIAWGNIHKATSRLQGIQNDGRLNKILDKHKEWFLKTRKARNSLEHLDERALNSTKLFLYNTDLGFSFINNTYEIFGLEIKFNTFTFKKIDGVIRDLDMWHSNLPTIFEKSDLM